LDGKVREEEKLEIIVGNLHPYYTDHLSLTRILSIRHLKELGKELEASRYRMENYRSEGKTKTKLLAPEFACGAAHKKAQVNALEAEGRQMDCWNCGGSHRFSNCRAPKLLNFVSSAERRMLLKLIVRDVNSVQIRGKDLRAKEGRPKSWNKSSP